MWVDFTWSGRCASGNKNIIRDLAKAIFVLQNCNTRTEALINCGMCYQYQKSLIIQRLMYKQESWTLHNVRFYLVGRLFVIQPSVTKQLITVRNTHSSWSNSSSAILYLVTRRRLTIRFNSCHSSVSRPNRTQNSEQRTLTEALTSQESKLRYHSSYHDVEMISSETVVHTSYP